MSSTLGRRLTIISIEGTVLAVLGFASAFLLAEHFRWTPAQQWQFFGFVALVLAFWLMIASLTVSAEQWSKRKPTTDGQGLIPEGEWHTGDTGPSATVEVPVIPPVPDHPPTVAATWQEPAEGPGRPKAHGRRAANRPGEEDWFPKG